MNVSKGYFEIANRDSATPEKTLLLIGTALDGPARIPFRFKDVAYPSDFLGESDLYHAYDMARKTGAEDIILYRLNGIHSAKDISGMVYDAVLDRLTEQTVLSLQAVSAHESYNKIRFVFNENSLVVYDQFGEEQRIYAFQENRTIKELAEAINLDAAHGIVSFEAYPVEPDFPSIRLRETNFIVELSGGSSESHLIEQRDDHLEVLNERLLSALFSELPYDQENFIINSELGMLDFGLMSVSCLFHDDNVRLDESIGKFAFAKSSEIGKGCLGVIGTKPIQEPTEESIKGKIRDLLVKSQPSIQDYFLKQSGQYTERDADWQSSVQIVIGDGVRYTINGLSLIRVPLSGSYVGLQASLDVEISTTNKQMRGFDHLSYELEKEDIDNLLSNGYISIIRSVRKGFVPYAQTTYVKETSSILRNPSAIRVAHYVSRRLTELLGAKIGSRVTPMSRREMMSVSTDLVNSLLGNGMVKSYTVGFVHSEEYQGSMSVKLEIIPHYEVNGITSLVKLPFMQGGI